MTATPQQTQPKPAILAWTDGSARPKNPGYGGWAFVLDHGPEQGVHIKFQWMGFNVSNNQAELAAIHQCLVYTLDQLDPPTTPMVILTDSQWAQRAIHGIYQVRKRHLQGPVAQIQRLMDQVGDVHVRWVRGHAGKAWNELADRMATLATYDLRVQGQHYFPDREVFFKQAEEFLTNYERIRAQS